MNINPSCIISDSSEPRLFIHIRIAVVSNITDLISISIKEDLLTHGIKGMVEQAN